MQARLRASDTQAERILSTNHFISVNSIAKNSAYQLQKSDIRVNTICPGLIETGMTTNTFDYARQRGSAGKIGQLNPLGRFGVSQGIYFSSNLCVSFLKTVRTEIANAALFLASGKFLYSIPCQVSNFLSTTDDSSYVNGQNIAVDGGLSSSHPVVPGRWAWESLPLLTLYIAGTTDGVLLDIMASWINRIHSYMPPSDTQNKCHRFQHKLVITMY